MKSKTYKINLLVVINRVTTQATSDYLAKPTISNLIYNLLT